MKATPLVLLTILVALNGCGTTQSGPTSGPDAVDNRSLARVAGVWHFSHAGPPSVGNASTSAIITEQSDKNLKDAKISIEENGSASMFALGKSMTFQVEMFEETPLYIKLGVDGQESAYTYDKSSKVLVLTIDVDADGSKGTMPAYFKRARSP